MKKLFILFALFNYLSYAQVPNLLKDINTGSGSSKFGAFTTLANSDILFGITTPSSSSSGLWISDGSSIGTKLLKSVPSLFSEFVDYNQKKYFVSTIPNHLLWRSDGTVLGTDSLPVSGLTSISDFYIANNLLFFIGTTLSEGKELWRTDGTIAGTFLLKDIWSGNGNGFSSNSYLGIYNNELFFLANDGINGNEIWKTNGTTSGTTLLKNIFPGSGSSNVINFNRSNNGFYFMADDQIHGRELWFSDGTTTNTQLVKDFSTGTISSSPFSLHIVGNFAYFLCGNSVCKTDGSPANTSSLVLFPNISNTISITSRDFRLLPFNNSFYLLHTEDYTTSIPTTYDDSVFISSIDLNLTTKTIVSRSKLKSQFTMFSYSLINKVGIVGSRIFYTFTSNSTNFNLFIFNSTNNSLKLLYGVNTSLFSSLPSSFQTFGNKVYYPVCYSGGIQYPGYIDFGVDSIFQLTNSASLFINGSTYWHHEIFKVNNKNYFLANTTNFGLEFYETDFTTAGTFQIKDIYPGNTSYFGTNPINCNNCKNGKLSGIVTSNNIYFVANDGINGEELWSFNTFTNNSTNIENYSVSDNSVCIFPNPSKDFITLSSDIPISEVSIFNATGSLIKNVRFLENKTAEVQLSNLVSGIYLLKITCDKNIFSKKIIKE